MNIIVCLKQVPEDARFDRATNTVVREKRNQIVNPSDLHALELALEIKDRLGAEVTVISMGKGFAIDMLRSALSLGAQSAYLISDPACAASDTYATATVLAAAIAKVAKPELVLCGRRAVDGETGQVGPELAVLLDLPCLTNVCGLEHISSSHIECTRLLEDRFDSVRFSLPCVLTCCDGIEHVTHPRMSSIANLRRAREAEIPVITLAELGPTACGLSGSPTRVVSTYIPEPPVRECVFWDSVETGIGALRTLASPENA